ncbi:aminoglycoside phosphotransferase family enzyme/predicted kinase [Azospirillum fermentarium]|uniref:bifunctional aminoglycoside phosphotransferase/ATP-binding protein n=1 Tax=Azospirillum fermentarium TaxID=1233114 RepID=UPI0022261DB2|nr:AAA family ATPase [Azospirillum fermentarium]MCW2247329.1 aminoglycoside phosphotransferase family enzyme/predicted kinase [Azospirillum fermentarium]
MTAYPHGPGGTADVPAFLGDPRTHGGAAVERIDTHAASVFLAGDRAWKIKRPVRLPYLDFSTRARRWAALRTELALNASTAPGLYLGLWAVAWRDGAPVLLPADDVADEAAAEPVLLMRRFPADAALDRMAAAGTITPALAHDLGDAVADLHAQAPVRAGEGAAAALAAVADGNAAEMRARTTSFPADAVEDLARSTAAALRRWGPLLEARGVAGRVRRCHGDLHLGNIVMWGGRPTPFDAIEFDESFATIDVLYDLAFLVMDLERLGLRAAAHAVLNRWLERTGDWGGLGALPLFLSLRAAVRAKVAAAMGRGDAALDDLALARRLLAPPGPAEGPARVVAVGGLSGTGKTTLARALAPGLGPAPGAVILRSDVLRKRMWGVDPETRLPPAAYAPAVTAAVYARLVRWTEVLARAGRAVIVDAVSARADERDGLARAAALAGVPFTGLWLEAGVDERCRRVSARARDASDADAGVAAAQEGYGIGVMAWHRVAAGGDTAEVLARAREFLS